MTSIQPEPMDSTGLHILTPPLVSGMTCIYENVVPIELNPLKHGAVGILLVQVMGEFLRYH